METPDQIMIADRIKEIQKDLLGIDELRKRIYSNISAIERLAFYKPLSIVEIIQRCVLQHYEVTMQEIRSKKTGARGGDIKKARHVLAAMLRYKSNMSYAKIGELIGRDHATAINSRKVIDNSKATKDLLWDEYCVVRDNVDGLIRLSKIKDDDSTD